LLTGRDDRLLALGGREIGKVPRRLLGSARRCEGEFSGLRHGCTSVADRLPEPRPEWGGGGHPWVPPVSVGRPRTAQGRPRTRSAVVVGTQVAAPRPVIPSALERPGAVPCTAM